MKVFVAGATGVLGWRAVRELVAAGHQVTGVARTPAKAGHLRSLGAEPVAVDLFDPDAARSAVSGHDVVCNLATHIPVVTKSGRPGAWAENDRIRTEASRNLVDAAVATGASRYIQESIAFQYADGGDRWLDEDAPKAEAPVLVSVRAAEGEAARFASAGGGVGGVAVVLRFAMFYGAGAAHTGTQLRTALSGVAPVLGDADGYQTMLHLDDAATAVVAALKAPSGTYNVAEERPATRRELADAISDALGLPPPWIPPKVASKAGGAGGSLLASSQRVSASRFRAATGWAPAYPDPASGWRQVVAESGMAPTPAVMSRDRTRRLWVRVALAYLAVQAAVLGVWATFAPHWFFRSFPGLGRHWVEMDGPYNHHLVSDVGGLFLALTLVTIVAAGSRGRALVRTAGGAWIISALPHFIYHASHRAGLSASDFAATLMGLGLEVILGVVCVVLAPPARSAQRLLLTDLGLQEHARPAAQALSASPLTTP
jgi:nucleoside-diphosphate-sugar epimerase